MTKVHEDSNLFEQLKAALEDSIAYSKEELSLKTTEMPAPPASPPISRIAD